MTNTAPGKKLRPLSERSISLIQNWIRKDRIHQKIIASFLVGAGLTLVCLFFPPLDMDNPLLPMTALLMAIHVLVLGLILYALGNVAYYLMFLLKLRQAKRINIEGGTLDYALRMDNPLAPISTEDLTNLREDQSSFSEIGDFFKVVQEQGREIVEYEHQIIKSHMEAVRRSKLYSGE